MTFVSEIIEILNEVPERDETTIRGQDDKFNKAKKLINDCNPKEFYHLGQNNIVWWALPLSLLPFLIFKAMNIGQNKPNIREANCEEMEVVWRLNWQNIDSQSFPSASLALVRN